MVDPPAYRAEPDPEFADRLERVLLQRLTAPGGSPNQREVARRVQQEPTDVDPDDPDTDPIMLERRDRRREQGPMSPHRRSPGRWLLVAAVAGLIAVVGTLLVMAGDDDDEQVPATAGPASAADVAAFCDAIDDMGLAVSLGEGYEGVDEALVAAEEIAPEEIRADVTTMADESRAQLDAGPPPAGTPPSLPPDEFFVAADAVGDYMADSCGYQVVDITATDHAFAGIPAVAEAGKTLIRITNQGTEYHEAVLQRISAGETRSVEEILAIPEGSGDLLDYAGSAFAPPGLGSWTVVDLVPGRYAAMCFIPTGATTEEELRGGQGDDTAQLHHTQGMFAEMQVP